jgi:hypothetical protein
VEGGRGEMLATTYLQTTLRPFMVYLIEIILFNFSAVEIKYTLQIVYN